jgi:hypothetical protein
MAPDPSVTFFTALTRGLRWVADLDGRDLHRAEAVPVDVGLAWLGYALPKDEISPPTQLLALRFTSRSQGRARLKAQPAPTWQ